MQKVFAKESLEIAVPFFLSIFKEVHTMINVAEITSTKGVEQAQKQMEQAKNRMALEKKKANEERRKFENHHKYMMGGAVHKYFKDCFSFEESEINEIKEAKNLSDYRVTKTANVKHECNHHGFHRKRYLKAVYLNKCFYNLNDD